MILPSDIPDDLALLDAFINQHESGQNLKAGTAAQIYWHDDQERRQTDYAIVYLHGFKASHPEGDPTHRKIADYLGANLYLSRLFGHGKHSDKPFLHLTENKLIESAQNALAIGRQIGKKVIIMGCSTGASLGLYLAAQPSLQDQIAALILYSPLIRFYGFSDKMLKYAFIRNLLRFVPGKSYELQSPHTTEAEDRIWNPTYTLQGVLALGNFVERFMHAELFSNVNCPVFTGYYYKNSQQQDKVVSVPAIKEMINQLGTKQSAIYSSNFPNAKSHVICSALTSQSVPNVIKKTMYFLKNIAVHEDSEKPSHKTI